VASTANPIGPSAFAFLRQLARNNDREWFNANKQRYVDDVRDPLLRFIAAFAPELAKIDPRMVADPRPVGGSLFRIYRDTRFSKDKSPYKTHAAMAFRAGVDRDTPAPGFYLHIEPGSVLAGAGIWHPQPDTLKQIRDAIAKHPERWQRASRARGCALDDDEERLSRPPRGYDPDHAFIEDLKRKSFTTSTAFSEKDACAPDFVRQYAAACKRALPLMAFLGEAVGLAR
jgi:uncharacterized protein (TIGR02453 family)